MLFVVYVKQLVNYIGGEFMNNKWASLNLNLKSELMRLYISNGIVNLDMMKEHYNALQDGGDIKKPRGYKMSSRLMKFAQRQIDKDAALQDSDYEPDNGMPQATFLMNRKNQQKAFEQYGYTRLNDNNYGLVANAVSKSPHKGIPVYQKYPDADVDKNDLVKIGTFLDNASLGETEIYKGPQNSYLPDPAYFPVDVYIDSKTGKVYNQGWDFNDYHNTGKDYGTSRLKNLAGNILDRVGSPTVVTTGLQKNPYYPAEADNYIMDKSNNLVHYEVNPDTGEYEIMMKPVTVTAKRTNPVKPKTELRPASELNADEFWDMMEANSKQNGGPISRKGNYTPPSLFVTSNISVSDNTRTNINQETANIIAAREAQKRAAEQAYLDRRGYISEDKDKRSYAQRYVDAKIAATQNAKTDFYQIAAPNAQSTDVTPGQVLLPAVVAGTTFAAPLSSLAYSAMYEPMEKAGIYQPVNLGLQNLGVDENTADIISPFITDPLIGFVSPITKGLYNSIKDNNLARSFVVSNKLKKGVEKAGSFSYNSIPEKKISYDFVNNYSDSPTFQQAYSEGTFFENLFPKTLALPSLRTIKDENREFLDRVNDYFYNYPKIEYTDDILGDTEYVNQLVKDRIAEHNTFLRGVRDPARSPHKYDISNAENLNKELDKLGLPRTHENRLIYSATHYAPKTGSGRAGILDNDVTGSLYTSNSLNTAAGYAMSHDLRPVGEVAMVRRPYTLGPDRNKWLEEGDFNLYANDRKQQDFDHVIRSYIKELKKSGEYTPELSKKEINNIYDKFYKGVYGIYDARIDDLNKKLSDAGLDFRFNKSIKPTAKELLWTRRLSNADFIVDPRYSRSPYEYLELDDMKYAAKLDDLIESLEGVKQLKMGIFDPTKKQGFRALKPKDIESIIPKDKDISELSQMPLSEELKTFLNSIDNYAYLKIKSSKPYIKKGSIKALEPNDELVKKYNKSLGYKLHKELQSYISPEDVKTFESKFDKYKNLMSHKSEPEKYIFTTEGLRVSKPEDAYQHYIFRGPAGEKALDFIKFIPKDEYTDLENISRMHTGNNYPGVSRKTFEDGGSLGKVTPLGQWQYPGKVTTIPSNNITMKGVDYPVIGVSDTGDTKVMFPNLDYTFNGNYVTEYPINQ